MTAPLLEAVDVRHAYGQPPNATEVLTGVSFELRAGELCFIVGPSGSGKSTLLSIVAGLIAPTAGTVRLCGTDLSGGRLDLARELRRQHVGFIFQTHNLFRALSAEDNIVETLCLRGVARAEARARAEEALLAVGLVHRRRHRPAELSGGERQRVGVARAIASRPLLYIADEPTAALDGRNGLDVMRTIKGDLADGRAALVVSHDTRLLPLADRVLQLRDGQLHRAEEKAA